MPTTTPADAMTLSVRDAARVLGTSPEAVRKRLDRGTLRGVKRGRQWVVFLAPADLPADAGQDAVAHDNTMPGDTAPDTSLVSHLQDEVRFLRSELEDRTEEIRRRDHIIAGLVEQLRALPASTSQDASVSDIEAPLRGAQTAQGSDTRPVAWRRWWRRMTGG